MRFGTKVRETYEKVCVKKNLEKVLKYDPQELKTPKKGFHFIISTNYKVLTWQPLEIKYRDNLMGCNKKKIFIILHLHLKSDAVQFNIIRFCFALISKLQYD